MSLFAKNETNTGRQLEFDYLKGLFLILIFYIHSYQGTGSVANADSVFKSLYCFGTLSTAAIYIFVLGFGTVYNRKITPVKMTVSGIRLVFYQYLSNMFYVLALFLGIEIFHLIGDANAVRDDWEYLTGYYAQFINIFFMSGIIYLILALLKLIKTPIIVYLLLAIIMVIIAPLIYGTEIDIPVLGYVLGLIIGGPAYVSFTVLYYLAYALAGVLFGYVLIRTTDKKKFYRYVLIICGILAVAWWVYVGIRYGMDFEQIYDYLKQSYTKPDYLHVIASIAHILFFATIIDFVLSKKKKTGAISKQLLYMSTHISKHYAIHMFYVLAIRGIAGFAGLGTLGCLITFVIITVLTECTVRVYNMVYDRIKNRGAGRVNAN